VVVNEDDNLLSVRLTHGQGHIFIGTNRGMAIRFPEDDVRPMGRVSAGVRGINLRDGDFVEEVAVIDADDLGEILVVTDQGFGKRTPISEFRLQRRGGYGITLARLTDKNGKVSAIRHVTENDEILVVTEKGMLIRMSVAEIRRSGRATQGVRVIRLDEDDRVVSVALAEPAEGGSEGEDSGDSAETDPAVEADDAGGDDRTGA
jgi:DNA gyrase subunit A